jgi:hypothetical protein
MKNIVNDKLILEMINEKEKNLLSQDQELMFYFSQIQDLTLRNKIIELVENFAEDYQAREKFFRH